MPPPSLLSLLPAASVSPRTRRRRAPDASPRLHSRLSVRTARAPSPLRALPSSDVGVGGGDGGGEELHLLDKPFPSASSEAEDEREPAPAPSTEQVLASYLNFFQLKGADASEDTESNPNAAVTFLEDDAGASAGGGGGGVVYYDPRPGDLVVGVVVGGDARALDVDVGAGGEPALMLAKEAAPTSPDEFGYLACDLASSEFAAEGRVGVAVGGGGVGGKVRRAGKGKCAPVVGVGTVVFAEVLGRTLGGRPLLSARRLFRRVAWHRVRQMKQLNAPIKVKIFEWNAGGLLTRIEGLRAFLPKPEMMSRPRNFTDLKNSVGRQIHVCIRKIDERSNELIISEKEAWAILYLSEGALLEGTVRKLFPYGAQIRIGETNRSGLLHVSKITHGQVRSVSDVLQVGERVKALVIKSSAPDRIALSTKDLESEPGLFLSDKEKVFAEAEEMARRYRDQMPVSPLSAEPGSSCSDDHGVPFEDEEESYANWKWLKFIKSDRVGCSPRSTEPGL
ncbi:protein PIGMENT DEFECTIVE 338, chloroplastic-like [Lolium rigidum]|uniref:protein PIGMENT DEFECTIVE 338, chloroplastic-like n=1 Tax=Lolium rigidum TaxID=89674 RepID=UPI001F5D98FF|nr:protein PIGMENT DEFECTIVE 338, chloroplastic-like [Lolium rigidum]